MMQGRPKLKSLIVAALLVALAGCQTTSQVEPDPAGLPEDPRIERAALLVEAGEFLAAAALYDAAARDAEPAVRPRLQLLAADLYLAGGDYDRLRELLAAMPAELPRSAALHRRLLLVEIALHEGAGDEALNLLIELPPPDTDLELRQRYHRVAAQAFHVAGNLFESARELRMLDALLVDDAQRFEVQRDILRNLSALNTTMLTLLRPDVAGVESGWIDLALLIKQHRSQPAILGEQLTTWRGRYPEHPVLPSLLDEFVTGNLVPTRLADRIAVLLPESGAYAGVAAAIRDGLMAAWYQSEPPRPRLRFYDSSNSAGVWRLYTQAIADGAEMVVGPLNKAAVTQFVRAGELPVAVLALNQVEDDTAPPQNLFQYSLAPEDEARQVAEKAWSEGLRRPLMLTPDTPWGTRIADAFRARWIQLGGDVAGWRDYKRDTVDFSEILQSLLHLDRSRSRNRTLAAQLGTRLEFEPRRRADVDFVFMAAKLREARQIRPQLQFHYAGDLPVYTTSHAWNGTIEPQVARDVEGIRLPEMPWLVTPDATSPVSRERLTALFPASATAYGRLYAMGLDAFRLLTNLARLQHSPLESMDGASGNLYLNALNQVQRQLVWIELREEPAVLGYSPRLDVQFTPTHGLDTPPGLTPGNDDVPSLQAPETYRAPPPPPPQGT